MLHLIINNQTGFTTSPGDGRSSQHPSDMAKAIGAPVWHANADDPEAVMQACTQAAEWRSLFRRDAVVDLVGYRRCAHGNMHGCLDTSRADALHECFFNAQVACSTSCAKVVQLLDHSLLLHMARMKAWPAAQRSLLCI